MGEIADGIINGDLDQYTGEYLGKGGGFPRSKGNTWSVFSPSQKRHGVINWLRRNYSQNTNECYGIIRQYCSTRDNYQQGKSIEFYCVIIQDSGFEKFTSHAALVKTAVEKLTP